MKILNIIIVLSTVAPHVNTY